MMFLGEVYIKYYMDLYLSGKEGAVVMSCCSKKSTLSVTFKFSCLEPLTCQNLIPWHQTTDTGVSFTHSHLEKKQQKWQK